MAFPRDDRRDPARDRSDGQASKADRRSAHEHQVADPLDQFPVRDDVGPADVQDRPATRSAVAHRARNSTRSRSSSGCVRLSCHAGTASTGRRSTSRTRKRNDRDRAPITIDARSATESGRRSSRIRSTCARLERCADRGPAAGRMPPRYTIRRTPDFTAASANARAARRSTVENCPRSRLHRVDQVVGDVDPVEGRQKSGASDRVTLDDRDVERDLCGLASESADCVTVAKQPRYDGGADVSGDAGHKDVHPGVATHGARWTKLRSSRRASGAPASSRALWNSPITISSTR